MRGGEESSRILLAENRKTSWPTTVQNPYVEGCCGKGAKLKRRDFRDIFCSESGLIRRELRTGEANGCPNKDFASLNIPVGKFAPAEAVRDQPDTSKGEANGQPGRMPSGRLAGAAPVLADASG